MIRHCVEESNVDSDMTVIDPTKIRHVTIAGGRIALVSGLIDRASHLNLDFPDHRVTICVIAERFEVGAKVMMDNDGLVLPLFQGLYMDIMGILITHNGW